MSQVFLVEFTAIVDSTGTPTVFRFSSASQFMTRPTEDPPNATYSPYIASAGQYERHAWSKGATRGTSTRGFGVINLVNDGTFDPMLTYGLDGQPVRVLYGPDAGSYPTDFTVLFSGALRRGQFPSRTEFDLVLVDRQGDAADLTFQLTKFMGTNSGASGVEGLPADIQGKPKPKLRGRCFNVPAICVNTSALIYQVDDGSALPVSGGVFLDNVWDKRVMLNAGAARSSLASLQANTPSAGYYDWYSGTDGWYFKLGSTPNGLVTCDCHEGAQVNRTTAQIVSRVASTEGQLPLNQMDGITALDGLKPYECGIWVGAESTVGQVIDAVLDSANAFMTDTRSGRIQFGCLQDPAAMTPVTTVYDWMVKDEQNGYLVTGTNDTGVGLRLSNNFDGTAQRYSSNQDTTLGLPSWRILLLYALNNQVMSATDLAGALQADIAYTRLQYRTVTAADPTVLTQHRKAPEFTATTLICYVADATVEAASQLALRKPPRYCYILPLDPGQLDQNNAPVTASIDLGKCLTLVSSRFGAAAGKNLLCIGIAEDFGNQTTAATSTIYAWG